jgi:hypothetical protein
MTAAVNANGKIDAARMGPPELTGLRIVLAGSKLRRPAGSVTHGAICIVYASSRASVSIALALAIALAVSFAFPLTIVAVVAIVVGTGTAAIPAVVSASVAIVVPTYIPTSVLAAATSASVAFVIPISTTTATVITTATAITTATVAVAVSPFVPSTAIPLECGQPELNLEITRRIVQPRLDALIARGSAQGDLRRRPTGRVGLGSRRRQLRPVRRINELEDDARAGYRPAGAVQRLDDEGMIDWSAHWSGLLVARDHSELRRRAVSRKQ